jgi:hypothetical protein
MLVKVIFLFLLVMAAIGMIGNLVFPGALTRAAKRRLPLAKAATCPRCGRYRIGKTGCGKGCDSRGA